MIGGIDHRIVLDPLQKIKRPRQYDYQTPLRPGFYTPEAPQETRDPKVRQLYSSSISKAGLKIDFKGSLDRLFSIKGADPEDTTWREEGRTGPRIVDKLVNPMKMTLNAADMLSTLAAAISHRLPDLSVYALARNVISGNLERLTDAEIAELQRALENMGMSKSFDSSGLREMYDWVTIRQNDTWADVMLWLLRNGHTNIERLNDAGAVVDRIHVRNAVSSMRNAPPFYVFHVPNQQLMPARFAQAAYGYTPDATPPSPGAGPAGLPGPPPGGFPPTPPPGPPPGAPPGPAGAPPGPAGAPPGPAGAPPGPAGAPPGPAGPPAGAPPLPPPPPPVAAAKVATGPTPVAVPPPPPPPPVAAAAKAAAPKPGAAAAKVKPVDLLGQLKSGDQLARLRPVGDDASSPRSRRVVASSSSPARPTSVAEEIAASNQRARLKSVKTRDSRDFVPTNPSDPATMMSDASKVSENFFQQAMRGRRDGLGYTERDNLFDDDDWN